MGSHILALVEDGEGKKCCLVSDERGCFEIPPTDFSAWPTLSATMRLVETFPSVTGATQWLGCALSRGGQSTPLGYMLARDKTGHTG